MKSASAFQTRHSVLRMSLLLLPKNPDVKSDETRASKESNLDWLTAPDTYKEYKGIRTRTTRAAKTMEFITFSFC